MTRSDAAKLRARAEEHDRDAAYHEASAARHAGSASHFRKSGDVDRAREFEIQRDAAAKCAERAGLRAFGARLAAARLEHAAARTAALSKVVRAA